jgi:hypothetical protein
VIFSKKLLCKIPIFLIHRLGSRRVYQKQKKKSGGSHLKKLVMTSAFSTNVISFDIIEFSVTLDTRKNERQMSVSTIET